MDAMVHLIQNLIWMVFLLEKGDPKELTYTECFMAAIQLSQTITEFVQLPGVVHMNLAPKMPVGIKLTGVTSYTYWP